MGEVLHIEDALNEKGVYVSTTSGVSMYPMLRNRRDTIIVKPPTAPLKKYDVPLYRRGDDYVLHRIIGKMIGDILFAEIIALIRNMA